MQSPRTLNFAWRATGRDVVFRRVNPSYPRETSYLWALLERAPTQASAPPVQTQADPASDPSENGELQPSECSPESLYLELHRMAARCMRGQAPDHTLQTTALVHEAYLKLAQRAPRTRDERAQFLAMASKAMRHVLVDHARGKNRDKRKAPGQKQPLDQISVAYEERAVNLLGLHDALERMAQFDPSMAKLVELRFFGGLSMAECAEVLDEPLRTLERGWQTARAWLAAEIE